MLQGELLPGGRPAAAGLWGARDGAELATLTLGADIDDAMAPYLRAPCCLHAALLAAARAAGTRLHPDCRVHAAQDRGDAVALRTDRASGVEGDALAVADGVWSGLRPLLADDGLPQPTGHLAYRGMARQQDLPGALRSEEVTVWLAPRMHLVCYPVRGGEWLNAVCVVQGTQAGDPRDWDHAASQAQLEVALGPVCAPVRERIASILSWRLWVLHARAPVAFGRPDGEGRIAPLGDAAHPMRPYLAQGAGMAIEDARELQRVPLWSPTAARSTCRTVLRRVRAQSLGAGGEGAGTLGAQWDGVPCDRPCGWRGMRRCGRWGRGRWISLGCTARSAGVRLRLTTISTKTKARCVGWR